MLAARATSDSVVRPQLLFSALCTVTSRHRAHLAPDERGHLRLVLVSQTQLAQLCKVSVRPLDASQHSRPRPQVYTWPDFETATL